MTNRKSSGQNNLFTPLGRLLPQGGKGNIAILALETSCDETAAAVLTYRKAQGFPQINTLSSVVKSQIKLHSKMGGVVPEVAARAHVKNILPVVQKTINDSQLTINKIDYIAVTVGPGLIPSLIVGVEFAKALSLATGKPMIPVNHLEGHLYSPFGGGNSKSEIRNSKQNSKFQIPNSKPLFPMISLIVSGGHTILVLQKNLKEYRVLGQTVDDAAGEAFDKVAKLLNLPYPGGPEVSKLAEKAKQPVEFPRPMFHSKDYNFSFAGLKTAVLYYLRDNVGEGFKPSPTALSTKQDICAGFQNAAIDVLVAKTMRAVQEYGAKSVSISGGVSANKKLRKMLLVNCQSLNVNFFAPPLRLSTDNAEMIGLAAAFKIYNGFVPVRYSKIKADLNLRL